MKAVMQAPCTGHPITTFENMTVIRANRLFAQSALWKLPSLGVHDDRIIHQSLQFLHTPTIHCFIHSIHPPFACRCIPPSHRVVLDFNVSERHRQRWSKGEQNKSKQEAIARVSAWPAGCKRTNTVFLSANRCNYY